MTDQSVSMRGTGRFGANRRHRILQAAACLLRRRDPGDAVMDELAREAGIAKGTLYLYFPSKKNLFEALAVDTLSLLEDRLRKRASQTLAARRLPEMFRTMVEVYHEQEPVIRQIFRERPPDSAAPPVAVAARLRNILGLLAGACRDARLGGRRLCVRPPEAALFILTASRTMLTSPLWRTRLGRRPGFSDIWPWIVYGLAGRRR